MADLYVLLFWLSVFLIAYTYLFYPALLWLLTQMTRTPQYDPIDDWPSLSLIICAYNEAEVIGAKVENSLALDYPADRLQIIVVSDCSEDGTDEIVQTYASKGVQLHRVAERGGKTEAQNAGVRQARGQILVFSDANSMYQKDALKTLLQPLQDEQVGCVCGELRYHNPGGGGAGKGEGFYWRYEQFLKRRESLLCSTLGANGSIYALKRDLFDELEADIISDFIMPIRIWRKGLKVVYEPRAIATEDSAATFRGEFRRRTRIVTRSILGLWQERGALNPLAHGWFAFQLVSHKLLRWLVPFFLVAAFAGNILLLDYGPLYKGLLALQVVFYALSLMGHLGHRWLERWSLFYVPAYFCATNFGVLLGWWHIVSGRRFTVWKPLDRSN
ncbi:MAG: glycosyltransferase [Candidatus Latescibacteria bacterium]|nr:glycosyltransferase [Candidatus Latescibacterota bacterium]